MEFLSLNNFLNHKNTFLRAKISKCEETNYRYSNYKLVLNNENLEYKSIERNILSTNDEIACFKRDGKIILFRNLSKNTNNFKEAKIRVSLLFMICFCAFLCFLFLYFYNNFMFIDLFFLCVFFTFFLLSFWNSFNIYKQIKRLNSL